MITYYGGKKRLAQRIVALMPPHTAYIEPYCGGLGVFFRKKAVATEVINDRDKRIIAIYRCLQEDPLARELIGRLRLTPFSRAEHARARQALREPNASLVETAWATIIQLCQSQNAKIGGGWKGSRKKPNTAWVSHVERLVEGVPRLSKTQIECREALEVIDIYDAPGALFYCDPPYPGSDQGHYRGFTLEHFKQLWKKLCGIKGQAMVSCYDGTVTPEMAEGWTVEKFPISIPSIRHCYKDSLRVECLWIRSNERQQTLWGLEARA